MPPHHRVKARTTLCPPNAKLFDRAAVTFASRAVIGMAQVEVFPDHLVRAA